MALFELCLLSFLAPQEPAPPPPGEPPAVTAEAGGGPIDEDLAALRAQERAGADADLAELKRLADAVDGTVAARAVWLLGQGDTPAHREALRRTAIDSQHAEARLQALHALRRGSDVASMPTAVLALDDEDRRVRTVAVQLLGKLRRPGSVEPLVAMIDRFATSAEPGPATDVQAALVALADFGAAQHLLRVATSIHDGNVQGTGTALAYCFQILSPQIGTNAELTLLIGVLSHREALLRRYAITRLTELGSPTAASALEGRLSRENDELRPLVEVALAQIRRDGLEPPSDELERAKANLAAIAAKARTYWSSLPPSRQAALAAVPAALLGALLLLRRLLWRRRANAEAQATLALVRPSDDYLEQRHDPAPGDGAGEADGHDERSWHDEAEQQEFAGTGRGPLGR